MPFPFWARRRLRGATLTATGIAWRVDNGREVRATMEALLLLLTGRSALLDRLGRPGLAPVLPEAGAS